MKVRPVLITLGVLVLLFGGIILIQNMQEDSDLKRTRAEADSAALSSRLQDELVEEKAKYVEAIIGTNAARCFRATGGK
jgi:low affinity Fe/Cu permease